MKNSIPVQKNIKKHTQHIRYASPWVIVFFMIITFDAISAATHALPNSNAIPSEPFLLNVEGSGALRIQNISGAATNNEEIVLIDDGGAVLPHSVFFWNGKIDSQITPASFPLPIKHTDLESTTWYDNKLFISTSMTSSEPDSWSSNLLTKIEFNKACQCPAHINSVIFKPKLLNALKSYFPNDWYARISNSSSKKGGINIEGMSYVPGDSPSILLGFRSPLSGNKFGNNDSNHKFSFRHGKAIIAEVTDSMNDTSTFTFHLLDLNGLGIRSIGYSKSKNGYFIIAGQANIGNDYALWFWDHKSNTLTQHHVAGFDKLCRPESVFEWAEKGKKYIYILSENAGSACRNTTVDALRSELTYFK